MTAVEYEAHIQELTQQRDDLLAALGRLISYFTSDYGDCDVCDKTPEGEHSPDCLAAAGLALITRIKHPEGGDERCIPLRTCPAGQSAKVALTYRRRRQEGAPGRSSR